MKLPAVAIAAAFACGIALGLWVLAPQAAASTLVVRMAAAGAAVLMGVSLAFLRARKTEAAGAVSCGAWILLGVLACGIARQPQPGDFVLNVVKAQSLDLHTPLRWHGRLRDEPARLPWGWSYELDLDAVELNERAVPLRGGLRLSYAPQAGDASLPALHAGDSFWVLAEARLPAVYRDAGAFDRRAYLARQHVDLVATLRTPELIEDIRTCTPTFSTRLAGIRRRLREELDSLFTGAPEQAAILRAMLLGDRSFVDRKEALPFQKTGVFHVLVVAGLHVGAFAAFLYWTGRKLRLPVGTTVLVTLGVLSAYVAVVEQRPPVLRAALMAGLVVAGGWFFRRLELLNSAALAALLLLVARPLELADSSFQLSFLAIGCIAGVGVPWLDRTVQPYAKALRGWRDATRDATQAPVVAQFRIDLRSAAAWLALKLPRIPARLVGDALARALGFLFRFWELFLLTVVLQAGMLPMLASDFHRITLAGPLANLAAVPLTGLIVPLGFLALLGGLIVHPAGIALAKPLGMLTLALLHSVRWFEAFPEWSYRIPGPPLAVVLLFFTAALTIAAGFRYWSRWPRIFTFISCGLALACAVIIATHPFPPKWTRGDLELNVLDVGQGDSLFLVFPHGHTLLIDGGGAFSAHAGFDERAGPDPGEDAVSPYLWSRGFQRIDAVELTHAHLDHAGGLFAVLDNFRVGELWLGSDVNSPIVEQLRAEARARKVRVVKKSAGPPFAWDGTQLQFLWPEAQRQDAVATPKNNDSLVLHLRYGERSLILPGDAEKGAEREIIGDEPAEALRADVLKIGHHGSKNSSTLEFLEEVHPSLGLISAGEENPYGHPSPELLERLTENHIRILRTDQDGAIQVVTDGKTLRVSCFIACGTGGSSEKTVQRPFPQERENGQQK